MPGSKEAQTLAELISGWMSGAGAVSSVGIDEAPWSVLPEEEKSISRAVEKRRKEFNAGRFCARSSFSKLDLPAVAVRSGDDRAPVWPDGVCGSISHSKELAIAVCARQQNCHSVGIDIEQDPPLDERLWKDIATPSERLKLAKLANPGGWMKLVFATKEAFYKYQYPYTRRFVDFLEVEIDFPDSTTTVEPECLPEGWLVGRPFAVRTEKSDLHPLAQKCVGRWVRCFGHVACVCWSSK